MRIGILGGAFNPPHVAHLVCAQEAVEQLGLDQVLLMPLSQPAHRELESDPGGQERARLCELAVQGNNRIEVTRIELERAGPSYTADSLRLLTERHPGDELTLILGADQALRLVSWERPREVLALARLAVAGRDGIARSEVEAAIGEVAREHQADFFDMPRIDISSSLVRQRVANDRSIRYLVEDSVLDRISTEKLYLTLSGAS